MSNLRDMIDGVGSLVLNASPDIPSMDFKVSQDVVVRRQVNRSGPATSEVMVGRVLAMDGNVATVSVQKAGGAVERRTVNVNELSPVTSKFKTQSSQFNPAQRGRM